jgi:L-lactate dehydrogenase complex protein LldG
MRVEASATTSLWSTFTAKAQLLGAAVMRTSSPETAASLLKHSAPGYVCTASVGAGFPRAAAQVARASREGAAEVVAAAEFAVAETGSVAINEPPEDRGACFLAERLWLLVPEQALVATLDDALARIGDLLRKGATHPLLMSGPSRTADIERVLTIGVHGPRALVIVVVGDSGVGSRESATAG